MILRFLFENHAQRLLKGLEQHVPNFERWAEAIYNKSGAIEGCVGFVDGTVTRVARPTVWQRLLYSGHKRDHGLKYLHFTSPDGLTYLLYGPDVAPTHDSTALYDSKYLDAMSAICDAQGKEYVWYADAAFALSRHCITGVRRSDQNATQEERDWTGRMNPDRTSVEWTIGKTSTTFAAITDKKQQKVLLQAVGMQYFVCVLLTNCHTCLYGSLTSEWFDCPPPKLEDYLKI
jgi:hypothetical protein